MDILIVCYNYLSEIIQNILILMLVVLGVLFTFKSKFVQFRLIKDMFTLLTEGVVGVGNSKKGISSFQAFCMSTASRVGTGNLAGIALAIKTGGPGAIFWMWVMALIGSCSSFVESVLAQIYKEKNGDCFRGGPAYYMSKALGQKWMAVLFSIIISIVFGLVFNSVQSNTTGLAFEGAFNILPKYTGIILTVLTGIIIFGGVKKIASFAEKIVPIMAVFYVIIALIVLFKNFTAIPEVFKMIIENAFGIKAVIGGGIGTVIKTGVVRGLFSNEAGMGSAPNAAATAATSHPVKQGLIQALGVFTDTLLICSATAFIILFSGIDLATSGDGIQLTQEALSSQVGPWGNVFIAICVFLFAFSSIIGNYYYGESNIGFLTEKKSYLNIYRVLVMGMVFYGSVAELKVVWNLADLFMSIMAIINLVAIGLLCNIAFKCLDDYIKQKKAGKNPVFTKDSIPGLKNVECWDKK